jgi:hypothetical protein
MMDFTTMLAEAKGNFTPAVIFLLVFALGSEVMGSNDNIKASSWYGLLKALGQTIKEQLWPKPVAAPVALPAAPAAAPVAVPAATPTV